MSVGLLGFVSYQSRRDRAKVCPRALLTLGLVSITLLASAQPSRAFTQHSPVRGALSSQARAAQDAKQLPNSYTSAQDPPASQAQPQQTQIAEQDNTDPAENDNTTTEESGKNQKKRVIVKKTLINIDIFRSPNLTIVGGSSQSPSADAAAQATAADSADASSSTTNSAIASPSNIASPQDSEQIRDGAGVATQFLRQVKAQVLSPLIYGIYNLVTYLTMSLVALSNGSAERSVFGNISAINLYQKLGSAVNGVFVALALVILVISCMTILVMQMPHVALHTAASGLSSGVTSLLRFLVIGLIALNIPGLVELVGYVENTLITALLDVTGNGVSNISRLLSAMSHAASDGSASFGASLLTVLCGAVLLCVMFVANIALAMRNFLLVLFWAVGPLAVATLTAPFISLFGYSWLNYVLRLTLLGVFNVLGVVLIGAVAAGNISGNISQSFPASDALVRVLLTTVATAIVGYVLYRFNLSTIQTVWSTIITSWGIGRRTTSQFVTATRNFVSHTRSLFGLIRTLLR